VLGLGLAVVGNLAVLADHQERTAAQLRGEQRLREDLLHRMVERDDLTGLLSRRGLAHHLTRAAAGAAPGAVTGVLFCDVDRFKAVNDTHGHAVGDAVLVEVAARLRASTTRTAGSADGAATAAVARTGGDEFVVVVPGLTGHDQVHALADRVRDALRAPCVVDGTEVGSGVSVGAFATDVPMSAEALLDRADAAMYAAKAQRHPRSPAGAEQATAHAATTAPTAAGTLR
jgi:cyclic di-GMP phosphodiesterase Gmr